MFGAEAHAIYQALNLFDARSEDNTAYIVFSDSTAALSRAQSVPEQASARAAIEVAETRGSRMLDHTAMDASP